MNKNLQFILLGLGVVVGAVLFFGRSDEQKRADAELGFTDIPGPIDELGAFTNRLSGGLLARFGSFLGTTAADIRDSFGGITEPRESSPEAIEEQLGIRAG